MAQGLTTRCEDAATAVRGTPARGRPKAMADEAVRAMIVAHARDAFLEVGYAGTTMDLVAARCRISKRTLYRLFPGKTDLFTAVVILHRQSMFDLPRPDDEDLPVTEALEAIFRIDIDEAADRERIAFIRLVITESTRFPEIELLILRDGAEASRRLLAEWLTRQVERGLIALADPSKAAQMLMDMVFGVFARRRHHGEWGSREERRAYVRMCIDIFVNGVARD
jgi:TetR/AcrR family transcriptional repressor of mexJK operon